MCWLKLDNQNVFERWQYFKLHNKPQQCGMCNQHYLRSARAYAQADQSLCLSLEYSMSAKLLTGHRLEFLSLKGGCTGSSESTLVKMPHCWKSHRGSFCGTHWKCLIETLPMSNTIKRYQTNVVKITFFSVAKHLIYGYANLK